MMPKFTHVLLRDVMAPATAVAWARAVEVAWVRVRVRVESIADIARASVVEASAAWLAAAAAARWDCVAAVAAAATRWDSIAACMLAACVAMAVCTKPRIEWEKLTFELTLTHSPTLSPPGCDFHQDILPVLARARSLVTV